MMIRIQEQQGEANLFVSFLFGRLTETKSAKRENDKNKNYSAIEQFLFNRKTDANSYM